jgi:hypothetical protein
MRRPAHVVCVVAKTGTKPVSRGLSRWKLGAVAALAALGVVASVWPAAAQFFDDRYPFFQQRR